MYKGIFTGTSLSFKITGSDQYIEDLIGFVDKTNLILGYEENVFKRAKALVYINRSDNTVNHGYKRQFSNEIKLSALLTGAQIHFENGNEYDRYVHVIKKAIERYLKNTVVLSISC